MHVLHLGLLRFVPVCACARVCVLCLLSGTRTKKAAGPRSAAGRRQPALQVEVNGKSLCWAHTALLRNGRRDGQGLLADRGRSAPGPRGNVDWGLGGLAGPSVRPCVHGNA